MGYDDPQTPFLTAQWHIKRTGTFWSAIAHIITAVIGSGVLSLAWCVAQLGWIAGPISMLMFAGVTLVSSSLLCDCYKSPDPEQGPIRNQSYMDAVKLNLGYETFMRNGATISISCEIGCFSRKNSVWVCGVFQQVGLYGSGIAYTLTSSISMSKDDFLPEPFLNLSLSKTGWWENMAVQQSLELAKDSYDDDGHQIRTGTLWTCIAHIITAVIGSGVLSLAWSTAQLGWIAGPVSMLCFAIVTYVSSSLLSDCYRSPHSVTGTRNYSYMDAVRVNLGRNQTWVCGFLQYLIMFGTGIAYVITTSICMRAIQRSNCFHKEGHAAPCAYGDTFYMLLFGAVQIFVSQIPDFHNMAWLSIVAAVMSFSYSFIGLGLGFAKVVGDGWIKGSIGGIPQETTAKKVWKISQALGDIAFAYPYSIILIEIQDTLKSPPAENWTMKKASMTAIVITTFFYLCCGCFGYAAFGDQTPGNLLTGFGFFEPYWLIDFANACIVAHLVGGYQVYSQPVFAFVERWLAEKFPNNGFIIDSYTIKTPFFPAFSLNLLRLCFRTGYVISTTGIAMVFPYFNQVLGVLGALNFWPLAIYFPVEMYVVQKKIQVWTRSWIILQTFSFVCLLVTLYSLIGSVEGLITAKLS
ncbi:hypothetical protein GIB67_008528 [Kingdonia uniflora]|uniref:Amino acid transporter transmembrane domain-containing protein n=1 Tax=Kingdonia uniflora TaxID=39325 RepID=A0A7J7LFA6_9MAGN|nr:hypothetical protein GIB67_008528 [Kingdonia uniflora]